MQDTHTDKYNFESISQFLFLTLNEQQKKYMWKICEFQEF